jgi:hypothetical protein
MRWETGREVVERLLADGELDRISPDLENARSLLESARRHLSSARKIRESDPEGAYAALYDAARKACGALLEAQGLRATSRGGHVALREAVIAQFGSLSGGQVLRAFDWLRRRRNDIEYPDGDSGIDLDEVDEALVRSEEIVSFAERLVGHLPVFTP